MMTPRQPPEGRVYQLRPRSPAAQQALEPTGKVISMIDFGRRASGVLLEMEVSVHACTSDTVFDFAWAAHQRMHPKKGLSFRRVITGARQGNARDLLYTRKSARLVPELEDWMETLHLGGRPVKRALIAQYRWIPARDGHDCDCTCAGEIGHGLWEISSPAWRELDVPVLLRSLAAGEVVQVELGAR